MAKEFIKKNNSETSNETNFIDINWCKFFFSQGIQISTPAINGNGTKIVFSYSGDLWIKNITQNSIKRLTESKHIDSHPIFSPNDSLIVFTKQISYSKNIYVMNLYSDKIKQLTHNNSYVNYPTAWSKDSKAVYFVSNYINQSSAYKVTLSDNTIEKVFKSIANIQDSFIKTNRGPSYFTNSRFSRSEYTRENRLRLNYRGGDISNIYQADNNYKSIKQITDIKGNELNPKVDSNGNLYFLSDRDRAFNIYKLVNGEPEQITFYKSSVKKFDISYDGSTIVFINDYQLYTLETKTKKASLIKLIIPNLVHSVDTLVELNIKNSIDNFDINDSLVYFISQGALLKFEKFKKKIRIIDKSNYYKDIIAIDNSKIIYTRLDSIGFFKTYLYDIKRDKERQLTYSKANDHHLVTSYSKSELYLTSGSNRFVTVDLNTYKTNRLIVDGSVIPQYNTSITISKNDRYVAFTAIIGTESDIFLFDTHTKQLKNLTNSSVSEHFPIFHNNKIRFVSDRTQPSYINRTKRSVYEMGIDGSSLRKISRKNKNHWSLNSTNDLPFVTVDNELKTLGSDSVLYKGTWTTQIKHFHKKLYFLIKGNIYTESNKQLKILSLDYSFTKSKREILQQSFYRTISSYSDGYYKDNHKLFDKMRNEFKKFMYSFSTVRDFEIFINDQLGKLGNSHTMFYSRGLYKTSDKVKTLYSSGISLKTNTITEISDFTESYPRKLLIGDEIISINNKPFNNLNDPYINFLFENRPDSLSLNIKRGNSFHNVLVSPKTSWQLKDQIKNHTIRDHEKKVSFSTNKKVAYYKINGSYESDYRKFIEFMNTKFYQKDGLIIDIRNNDGGNRSHKFLNLIYQRTKNHLNLSIYSKRNDSFQVKPIILIINSTTISDGEAFAAAFKSYGLGYIVGSTSNGSATFSKNIRDKFYSYTLPTVEMIDSTGKSIENNGVEPDIDVETTFQDREEGKDPQLDKAIEVILEKLEEQEED